MVDPAVGGEGRWQCTVIPYWSAPGITPPLCPKGMTPVLDTPYRDAAYRALEILACEGTCGPGTGPPGTEPPVEPPPPEECPPPCPPPRVPIGLPCEKDWKQYLIPALASACGAECEDKPVVAPTVDWSALILACTDTQGPDATAECEPPDPIYWYDLDLDQPETDLDLETCA